MENPYNLHFYAEYFREEALQEARRQHLMDRARAGRKSRSGRSRIGTILANIPPLHGGRVTT